MGNINGALDWMINKVGRVTYSMTYRNGPNSYDCSSAVYNALNAGGWNFRIGNTETQFHDLTTQGWGEVPRRADGGYDARAGDIFVWGDRGYSAGAGGHTGFFINADDIVHCNYGHNGMSINNHDQIWALNGYPTCTLYRYYGTPEAKNQNQEVFKVDPSADAPHWIVEPGDTLTKIAKYYNNEGGVQAIAKYNGIVNENLIHVGQKIFIPGPLEWIVDPGDTWERIDDYYGYARGYTRRRNPGKSLTPGTVLSIWS